MQFLAYLLIGGAAAAVNLASFLVFLALDFSLTHATVLAFALAAASNYFLCIACLFRHKARWNSVLEVLVYLLVVLLAGLLDLSLTRLGLLISRGRARVRDRSSRLRRAGALGLGLMTAPRYDTSGVCS